MAKHRQPSGAFFHRLKTYSEPKSKVPEKQPSWIQKLKESDRWLWLEFSRFIGAGVAAGGVLLALYAFKIDMGDRQTQRIVQAWGLVTRPAPGNSGKGLALEYLNNQGIKLVGIDLSTTTNKGQSYLENVNLSDANLTDADLSDAFLKGANLRNADLRRAYLRGAFLDEADLSDANLHRAKLSGARLQRADLSGANFFEADLSDANLHGANLSGANLFAANLSGANFFDADLRNADLLGADLSGAEFFRADLLGVSNLVQQLLNTACGDEETKLPEGFTIQTCPMK